MQLSEREVQGVGVPKHVGGPASGSGTNASARGGKYASGRATSCEQPDVIANNPTVPSTKPIFVMRAVSHASRTHVKRAQDTACDSSQRRSVVTLMPSMRAAACLLPFVEASVARMWRSSTSRSV